MRIKKLKIIILFTIIVLLVNLTINELIINRNNYNSQNELLSTSLSNLTKINNVKNLQDKYQNTDIKGILSIDKEKFQYPVVQALDNKIVFLIITLIILIFMFITILNQEKRENRREKNKIEDKKRGNEKNS